MIDWNRFISNKFSFRSFNQRWKGIQSDGFKDIREYVAWIALAKKFSSNVEQEEWHLCLAVTAILYTSTYTVGQKVPRLTHRWLLALNLYDL